MTELSPCALLTPLNSKLEKHGSAGVLIKDTKARIVSLKDGRNQLPYESGELFIKGPQVKEQKILFFSCFPFLRKLPTFCQFFFFR